MSPFIIISATVCFCGVASDAYSASSSPCLLWGQVGNRRDDYTYKTGIGGYKVHTRAVPWNEARITCEEEGGHLAIINSTAEANAVSEIFKKSGPMLGTRHQTFANIGFHDLFLEGQYITIHGQSLAEAGFTQWADGQPDNADGNENCGSLDRDGKFNDIFCEDRLGFICEQPIL